MRISHFKYIIIICFCLSLTACSFNNTFLQPTKVTLFQPEKEHVILTVKTETDTTFVSFETNTYQPVFLNTKKDTISKNFTIKSHVFKNDKGNLLNGWLIKPENTVPDITLLHLHGNSGFVLTQYEALTPLLEYNFQIFIFDYSGFGFSEGEASRENVLNDSDAALHYVRNLDELKNTKLVVYGQSLGGHVAATVAEKREALIDGLVIEGAFSSHKDIAEKHAGFFGRLLVNEKYSAYKSVRTYHKPLLVIHSTEDEIVPFKMGKKIFENANEPKKFYSIDKCHLCGPHYYAKEIAQKIKDMMESL